MALSHYRCHWLYGVPGVKVLVFGSFDVLHHGHLKFLNMASRLGDVIVGLGTDDYQAHYKHTPVLSWAERAEAILELGHNVIARPEVDVTAILDEIEPDYLVAGADWIDGPFLELCGVTSRDLSERNIALVYLPRSHDMSTSEILRRIRVST